MLFRDLCRALTQHILTQIDFRVNESHTKVHRQASELRHSHRFYKNRERFQDSSRSLKNKMNVNMKIICLLKYAEFPLCIIMITTMSMHLPDSDFHCCIYFLLKVISADEIMQSFYLMA